MSSTKNVIGYVRVSTSKQDIGPEVQIAALNAEARAKGWNLTIYREEAASAKNMSRPVLQAALAELKAGRAQVLAVSKLDRLSRSVVDFAGLLETSTRQGWALVCLDLGVDTTTITGAAMAQVTCTFAEMERKRIGERTREGMAKIKATTGKHMGRPSKLDPSTVERIRSMKASGGTLAGIARALNDDGTPTATGKTWHASTVRQVLSR
ncbi:Site-specific DNA recombinase [Tessaracoccus bendigoensis DSM 12906]|uniref:Site-specific DNA recombinase n=1 Tax=Tessaracoccus bendigoensis DSM 12906 TaxID=1123357 RepID=A0A1M6HVI8_9ACTN|nr:recombinase family protein [Tessaracoccus bendigoensis]SHJ26250.1 Site-specific DNA recombinase [Tessaracoccus bendigoensis DSM 12906]